MNGIKITVETQGTRVGDPKRRRILIISTEEAKYLRSMLQAQNDADADIQNMQSDSVKIERIYHFSACIKCGAPFKEAATLCKGCRK